MRIDAEFKKIVAASVVASILTSVLVVGANWVLTRLARGTAING